jgi:hypothetical protein
MTEQERTILSMLSYETPIKEKRKALNQAAEMADIAFLIRPAAFWRSWDYCAAVLLFIEDEKLAPYLPDLLQWVEALNDPGSAYVELRLEAMESNRTCARFECVYSAASRCRFRRLVLWYKRTCIRSLPYEAHQRGYRDS